MHILSQTSHIRRLLAALTLLPLLCACYDYSMSDLVSSPSPVDTPQIATANQYINLSIGVSAGNEGTTRADEKPAGGEDGDGQEAGFERENEVTGVTLMLYAVEKKEDNTTTYKGINDIKDETLAFIQYYPVDLVKRENQGIPNEIEPVYTTGDQSLGGSDLDLAKTYRAIVVANLDLTSKFSVRDRMVNVRDYCVGESPQLIYQGSSIGATASDFVMSLESDVNTIISFQEPTSKTTSANGQTIEKYEFDNIRIERLAARIDFWTKGAVYEPWQDNDSKTPGYKYTVKQEDGSNSGDYFVLTAVMPFNLYDGNEYLFKRIGHNTKKDYLASENGMEDTEVVLDPNTLSKTEIPTKDDEVSKPNYMENSCWLNNIIDKELIDLSSTPYMTMLSVQEAEQWGNATFEYTDEGERAHNIIVGYAKENTLPKDALLYYYATGLRIEGDYYTKDKGEPEHLVYYGFLRHNGEGYGVNETSYSMWSKDDLKEYKDGKDNKLKNGFPMNFGVVRNNIYRISIDEIKKRGEEPPEMTWKIMVKNWDVFTHKEITM